MNKGSQRLEPVIDEAVEILKRTFQAGELNDQELAVARLANSTLGTWAKLKQSESAQEAVYFSMARELAQDQEQLAHYIKVTMPHLPLSQDLKALPEGKKKSK
jgi:hypothetical protein